ncbi:MAG: tetratricopeptide repeat protein, partial [Verrucomicrobiota bacterium]
IADAYRKMENHAEAKKNYDILISWVLKKQNNPHWQADKEKETKSRLEEALLFRGLSLSKMTGTPDEVNAYQQQAIKAFQLFLNHYPKSENAPKVLASWGGVHLGRKELDDAKKIFARIPKEYPNSDEAKLSSFILVTTLIELGELDQARAEYKNMMTNSKDFSTEQFLLIGNKMLDLEFYAEAEDSYSRVVGKTSNKDHEESALYGVGRARVKLGKHEEAIKMLEDLLEKSPNSGYFYKVKFLLSEAYRGVEKCDEAVAAIQDVVDVAPDEVNRTTANLEIGRIYKTCDNLQKSLASYMRINLFADTKNQDIRPLLNKSLVEGIAVARELQKWQEALDMVTQFLDTFTRDDRTEEMRKLRRDLNLKVQTS